MRFSRFSAIALIAFISVSACAPVPVALDGQQPKSLSDLVQKIDNHAARQTQDEMRIALIEEGVRVLFGLHASELMIRHYYEVHSSAYVRWARHKEYLARNETDQVTVAEWLAKVETTRLDLHNERRKYGLMRHRLSELTGETFPDEMVRPPAPPSAKPPTFNVAKAAKAVEAAGYLDYKDPTMPNARSITYEVQAVITGIDVAWQGIVTARAKLDYARKNLAVQQQLYSQEQSVSLGRAMTDETKAEAELVRASGEYYVNLVRLAAYLDIAPEEGLAPDFLTGLTEAGLGDTGEQFVPKGGSGFGQDDQNK